MTRKTWKQVMYFIRALELWNYLILILHFYITFSTYCLHFVTPTIYSYRIRGREAHMMFIIGFIYI